MHPPTPITVSIMFTASSADLAEKVENPLTELLQGIPGISLVGSTLDAQGDDPLTRTQDLVRSALSALRDLKNGFPWNELHVDVDMLLRQAEELDCAPDDDDELAEAAGEPGLVTEVIDFDDYCEQMSLWIVRSSNGDLGIDRASGAVKAFAPDCAPEQVLAYTGAVFYLPEYSQWASSHNLSSAFATDGEADILDLACTYADGRWCGASDDSRSNSL